MKIDQVVHGYDVVVHVINYSRASLHDHVEVFADDPDMFTMIMINMIKSRDVIYTKIAIKPSSQTARHV